MQHDMNNNDGLVTRVEKRLIEEHIPYTRIHDSITVAPKHVAILKCITDEVMLEMVKPASTSADVIRHRIQRKRELAEKCTRYYPVMQRCEGFDQQVAAAETIEGAVTIKNIMELRNRSEVYFIGPRTIVFSDELAAIEFEPTEFEKAEMENEAAYAAAKMKQSLQIDPEEIKRQLERGLDDQGGWQAFDDDHKPELDREFNIEDSPSPESLYVYRIHREGMHIAALELRLDDGSWKEVDCANAAWLIRNCKWRYLSSKEAK